MYSPDGEIFFEDVLAMNRQKFFNFLLVGISICCICLVIPNYYWWVNMCSGTYIHVLYLKDMKKLGRCMSYILLPDHLFQLYPCYVNFLPTLCLIISTLPRFCKGIFLISYWIILFFLLPSSFPNIIFFSSELSLLLVCPEFNYFSSWWVEAYIDLDPIFCPSVFMVYASFPPTPHMEWVGFLLPSALFTAEVSHPDSNWEYYGWSWPWSPAIFLHLSIFLVTS